MRREVREEAGVSIGAVHILGSQPWPVGEVSIVPERADNEALDLQFMMILLFLPCCTKYGRKFV